MTRSADVLQPGTPEYEHHLRGDIEHYSTLFEEDAARERLIEPAPPSWHEAHARAAALIERTTGRDATAHVVDRLRAGKGKRMLSLGSGPGGLELSYGEQAPSAEIVCLDVNPELLALGRERARELGLRVQFEQADLNTAELPRGEFDYVFCHAALHHLIELEHVANEIRRTLRPGGEFIVTDIVSQNGYRLWPETRPIARSIFRTLPERLRISHRSWEAEQVDAELWEGDTSEDSMECIRSEDILPILDATFETRHFVPYWSISRRFFDSMYGPNFDLERKLDRCLFDWILEVDEYYVRTQWLRPETFFGIYAAK